MPLIGSLSFSPPTVIKLDLDICQVTSSQLKSQISKMLLYIDYCYATTYFILTLLDAETLLLFFYENGHQVSESVMLCQ